MKTSQTTMPALLLLVICHAVASDEVVITIPEFFEEATVVGDGTTTLSGTDRYKPEEISFSVTVPNGERGSLYADVEVSTSSKGPSADAKALLTINRTEADGTWEGDANTDATINYYIVIKNKGLPIDHRYNMPLLVKAHGRAYATQSDLGSAAATTGIEISAILDNGYKWTLLDKGEFATVTPTAGCKSGSVDECSQSSSAKNLLIDTKINLLLDPRTLGSGDYLPALYIYLWSGARAKGTTKWKVTSVYPVEYKYWGGWASADAFIDPIISIDPTWEHADQFELILSSGIEQGLDSTPPKSTPSFMPWIPLLLE